MFALYWIRKEFVLLRFKRNWRNFRKKNQLFRFLEASFGAIFFYFSIKSFKSNLNQVWLEILPPIHQQSDRMK